MSRVIDFALLYTQIDYSKPNLPKISPDAMESEVEVERKPFKWELKEVKAEKEEAVIRVLRSSCITAFLSLREPRLPLTELFEPREEKTRVDEIFKKLTEQIGIMPSEPYEELLKLPKEYLITRERANILELPPSAVSISLTEGKFSIDSNQLPPNCYCRIPNSEFIVRKLKANHIELYEYFELKTGEIILHKLLEAEAGK